MKPQPILAEVGGKLYALADSPMPKFMNPGPCFEVFNPVEKQWSPLPSPQNYTNFRCLRNYHAIAGTNLLSWGGGLSPGAFRFDMEDGNDWRLINNSAVLTLNEGNGSTIVVDGDDNGGDFVLFSYKIWSSEIRVHLISREFDNVVRLPDLVVPESVSNLLGGDQLGDYSTFVHLGGRRMCLLVSSPFSGPYSRTLSQFGEVDKMRLVVLVFEFEVSENREPWLRILCFNTRLGILILITLTLERTPKTSDAHLVLVVSLLVMISVAESKRLALAVGFARKSAPVLVCNSVYGAEEGDTCSLIADMFNLSLEAFLGINPNINCHKVFGGQWLCVDGTA